MMYRELLFPEKSKKKIEWLKIIFKWTKIILATFLIVSTIWGCAQIFADKTVAIGQVDWNFGEKKQKISTDSVFFEITVGQDRVFKQHLFHIVDNKIYEYNFYAISSWSEAWTITKSPFYALFVFPIAFILVSISKLLSGSKTGAPGTIDGISVLFALIITTVLVKLFTLIFTFKAQQNQEKMQSIQLKTSEIQAKYKHSLDPYAKQKMQMELMAIYKKQGINPVTSFVPMLLSLPFFTAMFTVVRATNLIKITNLGSLKLIENPGTMILSGHFIYLIILGIYTPIQIISTVLPMFLNRKKKQKQKTAEAKAALRKQMIIQSVFIVMTFFFMAMTPTALGIYGIINSTLQILQTLGFHYYNKNKKAKNKKEGILKKELFIKKWIIKIKKLFYKTKTSEVSPVSSKNRHKIKFFANVLKLNKN